MSFMQMMQYLEARLGHHQLPVDIDARELRDLFVSCALHHDIAREITQAIYKQNRCNKLSDPVRRDPTVEAVVPVRLKVLRSEATDLDLFHFIEGLCAGVIAYFDEHSEDKAPPILEQKRSEPEVVSISAYRSRRVKFLA